MALADQEGDGLRASASIADPERREAAARLSGRRDVLSEFRVVGDRDPDGGDD